MVVGATKAVARLKCKAVEDSAVPFAELARGVARVLFSTPPAA